MTTTTRRKAARLGGVAPLPTELQHLVSADVREASEQFGAALDRRREASRELTLARQALDAAHNADRAGATEAELAGGKLPKAQTPGAEGKLAEAERAVAGATDAAQARQHAFLTGLQAELQPIRTQAEAELERIGSDAAAHVDAIENLLIERDRTDRLLRELGDGDFLLGRSAQFNVTSRPGRDPIKGALRDSLDRVRANLGVGVDEQVDVASGRAAWQE